MICRYPDMTDEEFEVRFQEVLKNAGFQALIASSVEAERMTAEEFIDRKFRPTMSFLIRGHA